MFIQSTGELTKINFLSMSNLLICFSLIALINIVASTETLSDLLFQQCFASHLDFKEVVKSDFSCFLKNELKRINTFNVELTKISAKKL